MQYNPHINTVHINPLSYESYFDSITLQNLESYSKTFPCKFNNGYDEELNIETKRNNTFRKVANINEFSKELNPFMDTFSKLLIKVNNTFKFDIHDIDFSYAEYIKHNEHLEWHNDIGIFPNNLRKLSFSLNINDSSEYDGGDLQFINLEHTKFPKSKGSITFFPSFLIHRVTPVTKGLRKVMIGFITGNPYR